MATLSIDPGQHCTADDCYTYSHTARSCERPQPRRCPCPYEGYTPAGGDSMLLEDIENVTDLDTLRAALLAALDADLDGSIAEAIKREIN